MDRDRPRAGPDPPGHGGPGRRHRRGQGSSRGDGPAAALRHPLEDERRREALLPLREPAEADDPRAARPGRPDQPGNKSIWCKVDDGSDDGGYEIISDSEDCPDLPPEVLAALVEAKSSGAILRGSGSRPHRTRQVSPRRPLG